jgi:hypothetical protein
VELTELNKFNLEDIEDRYTYNGKAVPRVTSIISKMISEDYLMGWSNYLGFKRQKYKDVIERAATYGTNTHLGLEMFLKNKEIPKDAPLVTLNGFKKWWGVINSDNDIKILGQECKLSCPWFGGTYDLLLSINGYTYLVDFKTSNHLSYKYCLQLSAYNYMLNYNNICNLSGIIILQLDKNIPSFKEFVLDFSNNNHKSFFELCEHTFLSLVYSYYHICKVEKDYKEISKGMYD